MADTETELSITIPGGILRGTLRRPENERAVAVLIAGSGPTDRDGNTLRPSVPTGVLRQLAIALSKQGIGTLRFDKRGIGASITELTESELRFDTFTADVALWADRLNQETGRRPFLIGHSEGAHLASRAAGSAKAAGLVLLAGASASIGQTLRQQIEKMGASPWLIAESDRILSSLEQGQLVSEVPNELQSLFRESVQPYLISWIAADPQHDLANAPCPALIIQGTTDLQVDVGDAMRLASRRRDARLLVIEGMNHVLRMAPLERRPNLETYMQPDLPLASGLVEAISEFLASV
jgi:uncharacterized protein